MELKKWTLHKILKVLILKVKNMECIFLEIKYFKLKHKFKK